MFLLTDQSRMILGITEMITGKSWGAKTCTIKAPLHLPEMSNFGRSRHLKVRRVLEMSTLKTTSLIVHRNNTCKVP